MFSLLHKEETAHEDGIWSCAWGRVQPETEAEKPATSEETKSASLDFLNSPKRPEQPKDFLVTGGLDDAVKIWDITDNNKLTLRHSLKDQSLGIVSVAISSDGKKIASSALDSSLCIWDAQTAEQLKKLIFGPVDIWTVAFSPCNRFVISGSQEGKISMYGVESGTAEQVLDPQNGKFVLSIAYSPDGKYIASGAIDGIITIFDVAAGKVAQTLEGHAMPVRSLCFSPNSQMLLTASDDGHMKLYDVAHSDVAGTLSGHSSWVLSVAFSEDGKHFASSSSDTCVKIWDYAERKCIHTFQEHSEQAWGVCYGLNNDKVISVSEDKAINIYDCPPNAMV